MDISKLSLNQRNILNLFEKEEFLSVGKVALALKIPHPTAKQSLNRLLEYNMIARQGIGKGTFYFRIDENVILDTLGNDLVTIYQGEAAFYHLFDKIRGRLNKGDSYKSFAFKDEYFDFKAASFFVDFHRQLTFKGVSDQTIIHGSVIRKIRQTYRNVPDIEIRATSQEVPTGMTILDDMVANLIWDEKPVAIAIYSPTVVKRYNDFFNSVWEKAKTVRY